MPNTRKVGHQVYLIDDNLYSIPGSGSVYLLDEEKKALVDTGPASSANAVLEGIQDLGLKSDDIAYLIITHIHLDHSGGAGTLLKYMPHARVLAHYRAIKHLIDPSKLISSAVEAQGKETMDRNGEVLPIPESRLIPIHDNDSLKLSSRQILTFIEAPGHAPHELAILETRNQGLFVGDAIGHYVEGTETMIPITPPPSFDMDLYLQTLNKLKQWKARRIYFAHVGVSDQVADKLDLAANKLRERYSVISSAVSAGNLDTAAEILTKHICGELGELKANHPSVYDYWAAVDIPMSTAEHVRYYRKKNGI